MLGIRLLAVMVALLLPALLSADIVILKDGRQLQARGRYTIEGGVVKFRGVDGHSYEFPLEAVDLGASAQATAKAVKPRRPKVWTNDDIERLSPDLPVNVLGKARAPAPGEASPGEVGPSAPEPPGEEPAPLPPKVETREYWQERLKPLRDERARIEQQLQQLRGGRGQAISNTIDIMGSNPGVQVEDTIRRLERRRTEIQQQIADIQAEARRAGVPPGYVR